MFENDDGGDLLARGIAAAKANSHDEARVLLERALKANPPLRSRIQAWRYLAAISDDPAQKRRYCEQILAADPTDGTARRDLAILTSRLDPNDVVDPERIPGLSRLQQDAKGRRFVCPQCGSGRLVFAPDGRSLECEHCHQTEPLEDEDRRVEDRSFVAEMWTARGHRVPVSTQAFTCDGCGASFVLAPGQKSLTCPYCTSVYVLHHLDARELLAPDVVIPFVVNRNQAAGHLASWASDHGFEATITPLHGALQPVWLLTFIGEIRWTGIGGDDTFGRSVAERQTGTHSIIEHVVRIPASRSVPGPFGAALADYDLDGSRPYDARLLADWPVVAYDVSLEQAALLGRSLAISTLRAELLDSLGTDIRDISMNFSGMAVDSFKLALLPVWIARLTAPHGQVPALVSGQTGAVWAEVPPAGLSGWIERLFA